MLPNSHTQQIITEHLLCVRHSLGPRVRALNGVIKPLALGAYVQVEMEDKKQIIPDGHENYEAKERVERAGQNQGGGE